MGLLDLIFPKKCLECGSNGNYICQKCILRVRDGKWSKGINFSIFRYEGVIKKAVLALKYRFAYDTASELSAFASERLIKRGFKIKAYLVPVPLHKGRQNWRGFNQSLEIGKFLANEMGWNFSPDLLFKSIPTKPQVGLSGAERNQNTKGSFGINSNIDIPKGSQIIVFDDVYTTGSTMREVISTLKSVGFTKVFGLTIAAN